MGRGHASAGAEARCGGGMRLRAQGPGAAGAGAEARCGRAARARCDPSVRLWRRRPGAATARGCDSNVSAACAGGERDRCWPVCSLRTGKKQEATNLILE